MKESKNLKDLSNNILVGLYLDKITNKEHLSKCVFGLASQTKPVDVLVVDGGLSKEDKAYFEGLAKSPSITILKQDENGNPTEEVITSESSLNFKFWSKSENSSSDKEGFSSVFNDIFNVAIEEGYESFSIVEQEDALAVNWYETASVYMEENDDVDFFVPFIRNWRNGGMLGFINDASWVEGFAEEAGKFDANLLLRFNCLNPLGAVYRTESIQEYTEEVEGRFIAMKESIKLSHYYEFFLRMAYNDLKMMTVPRIGLDLNVVESSSFSHNSSKIPNNITSILPENGGISAQEAHFWMELAKKEYFFDEDRNKTYEQPEQA